MKWKKYWGIFPLVVFLVLQLSILVIGCLTESSLRSIPELVLFWFGILSVLVHFLVRLHAVQLEPNKKIERLYGIKRCFPCSIYSSVNWNDVFGNDYQRFQI